MKLEKLSIFNTDNEIINGEMWVYQKKYEGHPFWKENVWYNGYVIYKGERFDSLALRYDIHSNDVIVFKKIMNEARVFKLNTQYLEKFALYDAALKDTVVFHYMNINENAGKAIYAKVYDGKCKYYIQYRKNINNIISDKYTGEYLFAPTLFAKIENDFVEFGSKSEFLDLFENQKSEVKKFMRQKRIKFKKQSPENLRIVFQYYDSLTASALNN
ncbi:MAG TPA: hypothetical protein VLA03_05975 [Draconibacterium sp.]|nr:hypothetical protein [Draconibacterium sp.]